MALSDSSLAWAKPVVSPFRPRRPKPCCVSKLAFFSRPSSKPKLSDTPYCRYRSPSSHPASAEPTRPPLRAESRSLLRSKKLEGSRPEDRLVGKEGVSTCRTEGKPVH